MADNIIGLQVGSMMAVFEKWFGKLTETRKIVLLVGIGLALTLLLLWFFPFMD